jgi:hypothetical protein
LLLRRGSDPTGLKRRKDATSHIILDNLYFGEKRSTPTLSSPKRSHGHKIIQHPNAKKSSKPRPLQDTFNDLLSNIQKPLGIIWWNFFYDFFSIKNVADVNSIDSFVSKRNMEEFYVVIMKRFRSNWFKKTKGRHVTYNPER